MATLTRTVRFCVNPGGESGLARGDVNGFAGVPSMRGLGRYYELHITCRGEPDQASGYLLNIKDIDAAAHAAAVPVIAKACREAPETEPAVLLVRVFEALRERLGGVFERVRWSLTPYYSLEMNTDTAHALLRQSFDFSAAHRLHSPSLSDEQNRAIFGKCNNPSGHGHNYRVEPCVAVRLDAKTLFSLADLEELVHRHIIEPFDHTHLNADTKEFAAALGVNPTVENIARVFFDRLAGAVESESKGSAELRAVTVWETDRTCSTYPG